MREISGSNISTLKNNEVKRCLPNTIVYLIDTVLISGKRF